VIAPSGRGVVIASESPTLVVGLRATVRRAGFPVVGILRETEFLDTGLELSELHGAVIAPVGGITEALERALAGPLSAIRTVVLLPPSGVLIHSETLRTLGNSELLPLTAEPQEIAQALRTPMPRAGVGVMTRPLAMGVGGVLSAREQEVLDLLAGGSTNVEIGERLSVTENTVKSHLTRVYRKLGVRSRAEAITAYLETA